MRKRLLFLTKLLVLGFLVVGASGCDQIGIKDLSSISITHWDKHTWVDSGYSICDVQVSTKTSTQLLVSKIAPVSICSKCGVLSINPTPTPTTKP